MRDSNLPAQAGTLMINLILADTGFQDQKNRPKYNKNNISFFRVTKSPEALSQRPLTGFIVYFRTIICHLFATWERKIYILPIMNSQNPKYQILISESP